MRAEPAPTGRAEAAKPSAVRASTRAAARAARVVARGSERGGIPLLERGDALAREVGARHRARPVRRGSAAPRRRGES